MSKRSGQAKLELLATSLIRNEAKLTGIGCWPTTVRAMLFDMHVLDINDAAKLVKKDLEWLNAGRAKILKLVEKVETEQVGIPHNDDKVAVYEFISEAVVRITQSS